MPLLKNGFLEKIETWHVGLSCQYTHFMSFSGKSEHDTVADQATLSTDHCTQRAVTKIFLFLSEIRRDLNQDHAGTDKVSCFLKPEAWLDSVPTLDVFDVLKKRGIE